MWFNCIIMINNNLILVLVILVAAYLRADISACSTEKAIATSFDGNFPTEELWEIQDPSGTKLVTGVGGKSKEFCLGTGGTFKVTGWDEYDDTWNDGKLKVESLTKHGITYLDPWTGPIVGEGYTGAITYFNVPCLGGTIKDNTFCRCKSGKYESNFHCLNCTQGKYGIMLGGKSEKDACPYNISTCPAGYYCPENAGTMAIPCPIGRYGNVTGKTNVDDACPFNCEVGKYGIKGKTNETNACIDCPVGSYCNGNGTLIPCPLGRYGINVIKQNNLSTACPFYCQSGKYGKLTGKISSTEACTNCEYGTFGNTIGAAGTCAENCPAGKKGIAIGKINETSACDTCSNGKYQDLRGQSECKMCLSGTYTMENTTKTICSICAADTYQDEKGKHSCKQCDIGKFTFAVTSNDASYHDGKVKCVSDPVACPFDETKIFFNLTKSCVMHELFFIYGNVTIVGYGNNITIINPGFETFFEIKNGSKLNLEHVALEARREEKCTEVSLDPLCKVGGIIVHTNATLSATKIVITGTRDEFGAAIYGFQKSEIILEDSKFHHNYALYMGAVLYALHDSHIVINGCTFSKNGLLLDNHDEDHTGGGAIWGGTNVTIIVRNSLFEKHIRPETTWGIGANTLYQSATYTYHHGGVIYSDPFSTVFFTNCTFIENTADVGGVAQFGEYSTVVFIECKFKNNGALRFAGVVYLMSRGTITFEKCTMNSNSANREYYSLGVSENSDYGGVLYTDSTSTVTIVNSSFRHNTGYKGGSIYIQGNSLPSHLSLKIINSTFLGNEARINGGAISVEKGSVTIQNSIFSNNQARDGDGGGIYIKEGIINGATLQVYSNTAGGKGGGFRLENGHNKISNLENCSFMQNHASLGFAISISRCPLSVVQSHFENNFQDGSSGDIQGGTVHVNKLQNFIVEGEEFTQQVHFMTSMFLKNVGDYGSGIFAEDPYSVYVKNCNFTKNEANKIGGAIYVHNNGIVEIYASHFLNNYAAMDGGAIGVEKSAVIIAHNPSQSQLDANYFLHNKAKRFGGGIYLNNDGKRLDRSFKEKNALKIYNNAATEGGGIYISKESGMMREFHYSNFPKENLAVNGSNVMAFEKVEIICEASRYYPTKTFHDGISIYMWDDALVLNQILCPKCADGKNSKEGDVDCKLCEPGKAGINGYCEDCAVNTYQDYPGATTCKQCADGQYQDEAGADMCKIAPLPCQPGKPAISLSDPGAVKTLSLYNITISWENCNMNDGYELEISSHRSFLEKGEDLYKIKIEGSDSKSISIQLNQSRLSDKQYFARIRSYNNTYLARSEWSVVSGDYVSADKCSTEEYLKMSSLDPVNWKCEKCMEGATCDLKYNKEKYALIAIIQPPSSNIFIINGIKSKFGYWRSNKNNTYHFMKCFFEAACLGAPNQNLKAKYVDEDNIDPALINHPEMCNVDAGYEEYCSFPMQSGGEMDARCRLCTSCSEDFRRGYASPKCKRCPEHNFIWVLVAFILMIFVFAIILRLELSASGRKKHSSHKRRMVLSYMQMNTLLASIGINWPKEMLIMFDIQSSISTVGDHVLKIDCIIPNARPQWLVLNMQLGYALAPFIAVILLYLLMPCCTYKMGKRLSLRGIQTRKNLTIKALVLLLYMSYPSLARQAFVLWNCISIKGQCMNDADNSVASNIGKYVCDAKEGYTWAADASNYWGDYLFMAPDH
eukprot:g11210.t1